MKHVSQMRERAIRLAIEQFDPARNDNINAGLVISIHEMLNIPLRIEVPMRSFHARRLVSQCSMAISESKRIEEILLNRELNRLVA